MRILQKTSCKRLIMIKRCFAIICITERLLKKLKNWVLCSFKKKESISFSMSVEEIEKDRETYIRLNQDKRFMMNRAYDFICKKDKYAPNGVLDSSYFIQDI